MADESIATKAAGSPASNTTTTDSPSSHAKAPKSKPRSRDKDVLAAKRRCVSTACIACRRRKSKCDGNLPSCAACASVYGTECVYDPNSDHRRKGVYKKDIDNLKTRNSTLQTLIQAILNSPENEVPGLVKQIRTCESLDDVAESIIARDVAIGEDGDEIGSPLDGNGLGSEVPQFEIELSGKMGELRLDNGSIQFIGGTSNLIFLGPGSEDEGAQALMSNIDQYQQQKDPYTSWTTVTKDPRLVVHLIKLYFTWHYAYFTTVSRSLFYRDFCLGKPPPNIKRKIEHCTPLLVNAMLALGCHFTSWPEARADPQDSATAGDHFFKEAKRLILENDEHENPRLSTVQALALMSVREAGCGREAKGWVYSGMSFRMACDLGLNIDSGVAGLDESEVDARRITFWGCFLFDKCWSNYLGRVPQLPLSISTVPKYDVFPMEDAEIWSPYTDNGPVQANSQPSRTRAIALQISHLCEISNDLLIYFYHPTHLEKPLGKQTELKKLSELHTRLEAWRKDLPKEMEAKEGQLPPVLLMHMFFQLLFIHLFRPFLRYHQTSSPLPANVSPRKICTHAAATISKLLRLYKRNYGLRQICNIAVYIAHSACTIHLLNLPEKGARRDIIHGVKHLEEIAESWLCARRTLHILNVLSRRWKVSLPDEAGAVLTRADAKFGFINPQTPESPKSDASSPRTFQRMTPVTSMTGSINGESTYKSPINGMYKEPAPKTEDPIATEVTPDAFAIIPDLGNSTQSQPFSIPKIQRDLWKQDQAQRSATRQARTSPSVLFGGVDSLIEESQWWLKDQSALAVGFDNWNEIESEGALLGEGYGSGINGTNRVGAGVGVGPRVVNAGVTADGNAAVDGNALGFTGFATNNFGFGNGDIF